MFYFDEINNLKILKSDYIKNAEAFFTTRDICICDKSLEKENSTQKLIQQKNIDLNKEKICNYLKIKKQNLLSPIQTHSDKTDIAKPKKYIYPDTDALIVNDKNLAIFLNFADCTPIILYDENKNTGAIVHAGWRGTVKKIVIKTIAEMQNYGSQIKDITAVIGPTIGLCCYDVGDEVFQQLSQTILNINNYVKFQNNKIYVDLKGINKQQLLEIGVAKIDVCPYCTVCNNDYFFSYRKEKGTTLRHSAVLRLREGKE